MKEAARPPAGRAGTGLQMEGDEVLRLLMAMRVQRGELRAKMSGPTRVHKTTGRAVEHFSNNSLQSSQPSPRCAPRGEVRRR